MLLHASASVSVLPSQLPLCYACFLVSLLALHHTSAVKVTHVLVIAVCCRIPLSPVG
jgi:hypothetical protein